MQNPRAVSVDRAVSQHHRAQSIVNQVEEGALREALRLRVCAAGLDLGGLVVHGGRQAVIERARGGEYEALDAPFDARPAESLGGERVHLPIGLGVVFRGRVVREAREVDDAVHVIERLGWDLPDVGVQELEKASSLVCGTGIDGAGVAGVGRERDSGYCCGWRSSVQYVGLTGHRAAVPSRIGDAHFQGIACSQCCSRM